MKKYTVDYAVFSVSGTDKENEDRICVHEGDICCFALADGLGGHANGAQAADLASQAACRVCEGESKLSRELAMRCFEEAQQAVLNAQREQGAACCSTLTLLLTDGRKALFGHIGDSRVYHIRKGSIIARTLDHSVPQMLLNMGVIVEEELAHHPDRNRIVHAVGSEGKGFVYEISPILSLKKSDSFLLCSDGFWEWIENDEICGALAELPGAAGALEQLSQLSAQRAKSPCDDSSAVIVRFC